MNALAVTEAARNLGGRGAGGEGDGLAFDHHFGCGKRDAALFVGKTLLAEREGGIETEWLVGQLSS